MAKSTDFLAAQPGLLRRELVRQSDQDFVDMVHWRSAADAEAIMDKIADSPACTAYSAVIAMLAGVGDHKDLARQSTATA